MRYAGNIPPYPETQRYVPAVMGKFNEWRDTPVKQVDYLLGTRLVKSGETNGSRLNHPNKR